MTQIVFSSWAGRIVDNRGKEADRFDPVKAVDLPEVFGKDRAIKALTGWNGVVVRSPDVDIVALCRAHMEAVHANSCGKCIPCRAGTGRMESILKKIEQGEGTWEDVKTLEMLGRSICQTAKCGIGQYGPLPVVHALTHFREAFLSPRPAQSGGNGAVFESRVTAPCTDACPIHLDIPAYVECIKEGRFDESLNVILDRLPIPGVVGRVCVRPCESKCRRELLDAPISIKYLKRFVADQVRDKRQWPGYTVEPRGKTGKVAIVGAGPAGVTCAYHLAQKGHEVAVFEKLGEPGGMAAVGIPDYRLPRAVLRDEVEWIGRMGVKFHYGVSVGKDIPLSRLESDYDAVFIGVGAHQSTAMGVKGEDKGYKGFISGIDYLRDINEGRDPYPEGKKVVVVGGGNVAIDCVRCSYRVNKTDVNLVYRRTKKEMPADPVEIHDAEEEGVNFHYLTTPVRIIEENGKVVGLECIRMELGEPDKSGRRRPVPVPGSEFVIDCDIAVPAIGQTIDLAFLEGVDGVETTRWRTLVVDPVTKQTSRPKIFSAGDCETGPGALITACAGGRKAAANIHRLINGEAPTREEEDDFDDLYRKVPLFDPKEDTGLLGQIPRKTFDMLEPDTRKWSFDEVELGFTMPDAMAEAARCLRCYRVTTVAV